jgi:hypothetical protein
MPLWLCKEKPEVWIGGSRIYIEHFYYNLLSEVCIVCSSYDIDIALQSRMTLVVECAD